VIPVIQNECEWVLERGERKTLESFQVWFLIFFLWKLQQFLRCDRQREKGEEGKERKEEREETEEEW
jgi:hypothetical protein